METEYLRVDSNTVIYVELRCITSGLDSEQKTLLRKEILDLAKDDIQEYVEKFNKYKKRKNLTEKSPMENKSRSQVIRGENVKFLYAFSKVSVTHRVLTRDMQRGSKFKSCEVFPEKLVIYYQTFCKASPYSEQNSSQAAISSYFQKPGNQNELAQPLKATLSNIVSKSGPKLSKVKKKKWETISVCEKNPITVPERPDPFKKMAEEDERKLDTRMKIELVKDSLLMLQADLADRQKENIVPEQQEVCSKAQQEIASADKKASASLCTELITICDEKIVSVRVVEEYSAGSSTVKESGKSGTPDKSDSFSGDFHIEIIEESDASPADSDAVPNETQSKAKTAPVEMDSFEELPPSFDFSADVSGCPLASDIASSECTYSRSQSTHEISDTDLPLVFGKTNEITAGDKLDPICNVSLSVPESTVIEFEKIAPPVINNTQTRLSSNKLSSKSAERLSRKVAMIELSDSDSDSNSSSMELRHKDADNQSKLGLVHRSITHKEDHKFVFKKPKLSRSVRSKEMSNKHVTSNDSKNCEIDTLSNDDDLTDSSGLDDDHENICSHTGSSEDRQSHDELVESCCEFLPDIVRKKRTVLKRKKHKPAESEEDTETAIIEKDDSDDLPTISAGKSKLRRLGPKIKFNKSKKGVPDLFAADKIQPAITEELRTSASVSETVDATDLDEVDMIEIEASTSRDLKKQSVPCPADEPYVIEDDTDWSDRLLLEISAVSEVKYLSKEQLKFLVTSNIDYVRDILKGKTYCERHEKYKKGKRQQILLGNDVPMGQFREAQHDIVMDILIKSFCTDQTKYFDYVCKVILPEMLIKVCMDVQNLSHSEAELALDTVNMSQMVNC